MEQYWSPVPGFLELPCFCLTPHLRKLEEAKKKEEGDGETKEEEMKEEKAGFVKVTPSWLLFGDILHFCLLWFTGDSRLNCYKLDCCSPSNVNQAFIL